MNQLPAEIIDAITIDAAAEYDVEVQWMRDPHILRSGPLFSSENTRMLTTLRLVNKLFNRSATRLLFKYIDARYKYGRPWEQSNPMHNLLMVTKSTLAMHVHHLRVGFKKYSSGPQAAKRQYRQNLTIGLYGFLTMLPNLQTLEIRDPWRIPYARGSGDPFAQKVAMVLHCVPLPALVELRLSLYDAQDFGQLFVHQRGCTVPQIPIEQIMRRLRHLALDINGDIVLPWNADEYDYALAKIHTSHIQRLVEMAVNVESISIISCNLLNVDNIKLHSSPRLRHIRLRQMEISSRSLESLTKHLGDSITTIKYEHVCLLSGTWRQVLTHASKFTSLLELKIHKCGYSWHGESPYSANPANPGVEWRWAGIETDDISDIQALWDLQSHVNSNKVSAGRSPTFDGAV